MAVETEKKKWTTTLSKDCLVGIETLRFILKKKYDNEVIEYLVKKELEHEMDKIRTEGIDNKSDSRRK